jgi:transcriptional regulator with XRE-family HTH domain
MLAFGLGLHKRPIDVVRGTEINEGYLSQLISGKKKNPSGLILAQIADFLGIPMSYFYRPLF